jgi:hypothetical protein
MVGSGRIVLGVTGHRVLPEGDGLVTEVDGAIDDIAGERAVHLLTSLAEGADRFVAHRVLARRGGTIEAILPLERDDYEDDFADAESCREFDDLLRRAEATEVVTGPTRTAAYAAAGFAVVDRSDALLALWDGQPARGEGGTAHVVARARDLGHPVRVVAVLR